MLKISHRRLILCIIGMMIFLCPLRNSAQEPTSSPLMKNDAQLKGHYSQGSGGIVLFDDGVFMIYGFATAVFGDYHQNKGRIEFDVYQPENRFDLYGAHNPELNDTVNFNFKGFEEDDTYVRFNRDSIMPVFNNMANCFLYPYVHQSLNGEKAMAFYSMNESLLTAKGQHNYLEYQLPGDYNDFIIIYHEVLGDFQDLWGVIREEEGQTVLALPGVSAMKKKTIDEEDSGWQDLLAFKTYYLKEEQPGKDTIYANGEYQLIKSGFRAAALREDQPRRFVRIKPKQKKQLSERPGPVAHKSLFQAVCDDLE